MGKLQVALDLIDLDDALKLVQKLQEWVDIIEVGTPFLIENGLKAVSLLKESCPDKEILCDGKIMDAGLYEASSMFRAGADWVTVMACTDEATIRECVQAAKQANGRIMADLLTVTNMAQRVAILESAQVDCAAVHTGVDQQHLGKTPLSDLRELRQCSQNIQVAVAGGISASTVKEYMTLSPDILIVGGGILSQADPVAAAQAIRAAMHTHEKE